MSSSQERTAILVPILLICLVIIIGACLLMVLNKPSNQKLCRESTLGSSFIELLSNEEDLEPNFKECRGPFSSKKLVVGQLFKVSLDRVRFAPDEKRIDLVEESPKRARSGDNDRNVGLYRATFCISHVSGISPGLPMLIETYVLAGDESIVTGDSLNINPRSTADSDCKLDQSSTGPGHESSFLFELPPEYKREKIVFGIITYDDLLLFQADKPTRVPN